MLTEFEQHCRTADYHKRHGVDGAHLLEEETLAPFSLQTHTKDTLIVDPAAATAYENYLSGPQDTEYKSVGLIKLRTPGYYGAHYVSEVLPGYGVFVVRATLSIMYNVKSYIFVVNEETLSDIYSNQQTAVYSLQNSDYVSYNIYGLVGARGAFYPAMPIIGAAKSFAQIPQYDLDFPTPTEGPIISGIFPVSTNRYSLDLEIPDYAGVYQWWVFDPTTGYQYAMDVASSQGFASLRWAALSNLIRGMALCAPLSFSKIFKYLPSLTGYYLKQHTDWIRPFVFITNVGDLATIVIPQMPMFNPGGIYTLVGAMTAISMFADQEAVWMQSYSSGPTLRQYQFPNPGCQETDIGCGSARNCYYYFGPNPPYINVINKSDGIAVMYINPDQCGEQFDPWILKTSPRDTPILYKANAPFPEEYTIFEGFAVAKVFFDDITKQSNGAVIANETRVKLDLFSGTMYVYSAETRDTNLSLLAASGDPGDAYFYRDLTHWRVNTSELHKYQTLSYKYAANSDNITLIEGRLNNMVMTVPGKFLFSMSSTSTLRALEEKFLTQFTEAVTQDGSIPSRYDVSIPVYLLLVTTDQIYSGCTQGYERLVKYAITDFWVVHGGAMMSDPWRTQAYRFLENASCGVNLFLYTYELSMAFELANDFSELANIKNRKVKVSNNHSIFNTGLPVKISGEKFPEKEFHLSLSDGPQELMTSGLNNIWSYSYEGRPTFAKIYWDEENNLIYTHTDTKLLQIPIDSLNQYKEYEFRCFRDYRIRVVGDMEAFAKWGKQFIE